jgi:3-oxoacyl-[acyl-carrier protein] reductase
MRLKDKVAIVTGSNRGIGLATAICFAEEGAIVIAGHGRKFSEELEEAASKEYPGKLITRQFDVIDRAGVKEAVDSVVGEFGRIDILVNNAGVVRDATLEEMTEEDYDVVVDTNMKGTFNCTQAVAPTMLKQESGTIINATSLMALYGNYGQTNYVGSKAALIGMTRVWARELGPSGIRVNAVAPGWIESHWVDDMPEDVWKKMESWISLQRKGTPQEVARVYLFLASDESSYITGHILSVDGGARV